MGVVTFVHSLFGWIYFFAWSASFWPQVVLNQRRRTTAGLSPDFMAINIVGFVSYAIYTFWGFFDGAVGESYKRATGVAPQVELNDVLFAAHGAVMCCALVVQLAVFPPRTAPKRYTAVGCGAVLAAVVAGLGACVRRQVEWYTYLRWAGAVKVVASVIKHFPQLYLNQRRTSTVGWSFSMIVLDVVGGVFSMGQQVVRCVMVGSMAPFSGNMAKTTLALESLMFDFYFIAQHVWLYPDHTDFDVLQMKGAAGAAGVDVEKGAGGGAEAKAGRHANGTVWLNNSNGGGGGGDDDDDDAQVALVRTAES